MESFKMILKTVSLHPGTVKIAFKTVSQDCETTKMVGKDLSGFKNLIGLRGPIHRTVSMVKGTKSGATK